MDDALALPREVITDGPLTRDVDAIVQYVAATRGLGNRAARRYVGRRLTQTTLSWWRATGLFPIGFRNPDPQFHDDAGHTLRSIMANRKGRK